MEHAVEAAKYLQREEGLAVRVVALTQLSPFPVDEIVDATRDITKVVVVEEGTAGWNLASECARHLIGRVTQFCSISAPPHPIPSSPKWEKEILPNSSHITEAILNLFTSEVK